MLTRRTGNCFICNGNCAISCEICFGTGLVDRLARSTILSPAQNMLYQPASSLPLPPPPLRGVWRGGTDVAGKWVGTQKVRTHHHREARARDFPSRRRPPCDSRDAVADSGGGGGRSWTRSRRSAHRTSWSLTAARSTCGARCPHPPHPVLFSSSRPPPRRPL